MMNGKKYLYTLIFIISAILLINIIWPSAFLSKFKKEVFHNFKDNSEAYIKIKDYCIQKYEENNSDGVSIGWYGEITDNSNDAVKKSTIQYAPQYVQDEINKLIIISQNDYDFARIKKYKEEYIITFEFDWEGGRNKTHKIIYCEDKKTINEYLKSQAEKIYIKNIMDNWYYVELDPDIFHK